MKRTISALSALFVICALAPAASAQTTAPGLNVTSFTDSTPTVNGPNCSPDGGSYTFQVNGTNTGSYAGTYTETGTVTLGPETSFRRQPILSMTANFSIQSPNGNVSGTKTYVAGTSTGNGSCEGLWDGSLRASLSAQAVSFNATFQLPDGRTCTQQGTSSLSLYVNLSTLVDQFSEPHIATPTATCTGNEEPPPPEEPEQPQTVDDCKKDGWVTYGFLNQGQCISFVLHRDNGV